jgi:hypothetical protein
MQDVRQYARLNAEDDDQSAQPSARSSLQRRSASYDSMVKLFISNDAPAYMNADKFARHLRIVSQTRRERREKETETEKLKGLDTVWFVRVLGVSRCRSRSKGQCEHGAFERINTSHWSGVCRFQRALFCVMLVHRKMLVCLWPQCPASHRVALFVSVRGRRPVAALA